MASLIRWSVFEDSRLCLRVRNAYDPKTGKTGVRFTVADTGSGMSRAILQRIWEPFFTTKVATGTGLGLWVTQEIIRKHHGSVSVLTSTERRNHGSVFSIFLPHTGDRLARFAVLCISGESAWHNSVKRVQSSPIESGCHHESGFSQRFVSAPWRLSSFGLIGVHDTTPGFPGSVSVLRRVRCAWGWVC